MTLAQGFVVLSQQDGDAPACPAVGTVSKQDEWDDGGWALGAAWAKNGSIWIDRAFWTGNPDPAWVAARCDEALDAGASWAQVGNELNLELEGFQGGPAEYFQFEDAVRAASRYPGQLLAMPPSPGVPDWQQWVRSAGEHACHAYGTFDQMRATVEWYLANTSGRIVVTECNFGAGNAVDVDAWAGSELLLFLDWCATQPRVVACLYFAWVWRGAPPMPTPVDARGTAVERVIATWVPPMTGGAGETWYEGATRRPISVNYTPGRGGHAPVVLVDHVADGLGSPYGWFNTDRGASGSSSTFWVSRGGAVEQYRPLEDTTWANGILDQPDMTSAAVAAIVASGVDPNAVSVSIETEGFPGDVFPEAQVAASRALHQWLSGVLGIPLTRERVLAHAQFDSVNRPYCPGPTFPWEEVMGTAPPAFDINAVRDQVWRLAGECELNGWPWYGQSLKAATSLSKQEH